MLSFVIPAHNEEFEIRNSIDSIHAAATHAGEPYEVVVVDDASTDRTVEIATAGGARVVSIHRRQIAAARNAGARAAQGNVLFFVDADTRIAAGHVTGALAALAAGCSGGSARLRLDRTVPLWVRVFLGAFCAVYFAANLGVGAFMFTRRRTFEAVGGFDEQYFAAEEAYLTLALKKLGRFAILPEPIITSARKVRMHSPAHVVTQSLFIVFGGKRALRTRERLHLWYDGKREGSAG